MAKKFVVAGNIAAVTTTYKTMAIVTATAAIRPAIYDYIVGVDGTPADNAMRFGLARFTVAGTTTAQVPAPLDSADPAAISVCGINASAEPTYTATQDLLYFPLNQRATFRWVAAPDSELRAPATAANGIGAVVLSPAYVSTAKCTVLFQE